MTALIGVLGLWVATAGVPAATAPDGPGEPALQGTWIFTTLVIDGQEVPRPRLDAARLIIAGDSFLWANAGDITAGTLVAARDSVPWSIDLEFGDGPRAGETARGIWRLDDGWLTICLGAPGQERPATFEALPGSGRALQILTQDARETRLPDIGPLPGASGRDPR